MFRFNTDPDRAEAEMQAIVFYLTTFGYVDGDFDSKERAFVRGFIEKLVRIRAESALRGQDEALKNEAIRKYTTPFE